MSTRRRPEHAPRPVQLRFLSHQLPVELYGDFIHWSAPQPMRQLSSAEWEATLHLPPGVYAYKFRTYDGAWHLDPENPRTRATDSGRNNLLIIDGNGGGSEEPVLHAAASPLLFLEADGRLCVRAGLRRGHGERLTLRLFEPTQSIARPGEAGFRDVLMKQTGAEHEHLLFEAHVPMAAPALDYLFVLESGRRIGQRGGQALRIGRKELRSPAPKWWREAVLYTVFLDRFRASQPLRREVDERARLGGDLEGVRQALPYLQDLGVTALHLTPISLSHSAHRYDAINPKAVDPALGGEEALLRLLEAARQRELRILLDVVLTHVHRDFLPFCDVRRAGRASRYASWFHLQRHPFFEGPDPGYSHYQKGQWQEPLLRTDEDEVADYLASVISHFARLGVDGFRLDAAADVPLDLLERLRQAALEARPEAVLFGEVTTDNSWRFTGQALDAATDFGHQQALHDWLWHRRSTGQAAGAALARRSFMCGPGWRRIAFTGTHDQPRLQTLVGDARRARLGQLITLLGPGIPAIYYGDEQGLHSAEPSRAFEDAWPDRLAMPWPDEDAQSGDAETHAMVRTALRLRREHPALHRGESEAIELPDCAEVLALRRRSGDEIIEIYANGAESEQVVSLPPGPAVATVLLALEAVASDGQGLRLGPLSAVVIARRARPEVQAAWQALREQNRDLCAAAFRSGQLAAPFLPTHLYLTVTERCNLRCLHCITDAPARTSEGRARTMQPWLLDALAEPLRAADYFGFAHGGESLVEPIFFDLLQRIQELHSHSGRHYDAHLLSNGMLLDEATAERLCELGLTSLAVSLDGGTERTNDSVRLGADFERILRNVEGVLAVRSRLGADLRVGVSTVLTQGNAAELVQLGERLAAIGVDWIKVEELYPVNAFSARELLRPRGQRARDALNALRAAVEPAGLVVVDHLAPPQGCPCESTGSDALAEFRATDDFANRARFRSCQAAWEQASVDPDGTVRPIDPFHLPLGNVADEPFLALWQGERAQRVRAQAIAKLDPCRRERCPE